jgi:hypothetical protein
LILYLEIVVSCEYSCSIIIPEVVKKGHKHADSNDIFFGHSFDRMKEAYHESHVDICHIGHGWEVLATGLLDNT